MLQKRHLSPNEIKIISAALFELAHATRASDIWPVEAARVVNRYGRSSHRHVQELLILWDRQHRVGSVSPTHRRKSMSVNQAAIILAALTHLIWIWSRELVQEGTDVRLDRTVVGASWILSDHFDPLLRKWQVHTDELCRLATASEMPAVPIHFSSAPPYNVAVVGGGWTAV